MGTDSHNQIQAMYFGEGLDQTIRNVYQENYRKHYTSQELKIQRKPLFVLENQGAQELFRNMYGLVFLSQGPTTGFLLLILYSFLLAGSVDRDHDRDSLSALCSYKSPDLMLKYLYDCTSSTVCLRLSGETGKP